MESHDIYRYRAILPSVSRLASGGSRHLIRPRTVRKRPARILKEDGKAVSEVGEPCGSRQDAGDPHSALELHDYTSNVK